MQANLLKRVLRVAQECIVSFLNFDDWSHRLVVLGGRMPVSASWPYNACTYTQNVQVLTVRDFDAHAAGIEIIDQVLLHQWKIVR